MSNRVIENPLPFALRSIFINRGSGELNVRGENFEKVLFFQDGNLIFARTNVIHERLGEILFKLGKINRTQFWEIQKLLEGKKDKLGKLLVGNQSISQKDLFFALIYQVRTIALSTFSLTSGEWDFNPYQTNLPDDSRFSIELPSIFAEGIWKFKNWLTFKNSFFNRVPKAKPVPEEIKGFWSGDDVIFFRGLTAYPGMTLEQICPRLNLPDEVFWQKAILLYLMNVIDFVDASEAVIDKEMSRNIEELIALYERLKANEVDYYDLLGLKNNVSLAEIKESYFASAKKFHPDRMGNAPDPDLREKANFVFARINRAYDVLSDEQKRTEYDTQGYKEIDAQDKINKNLLEKANILYRKAKTLYSQKKFWEASVLMEEAVRNDNTKAAYFLMLGLCQVNVLSLRRLAEKNFQKAIDIEPWNAEPYVALGMLFSQEKLEKRAEGFFKKALSINPDHVLAKRKMEEIIGGKKKPGIGFFKKK